MAMALMRISQFTCQSRNYVCNVLEDVGLPGKASNLGDQEYLITSILQKLSLFMKYEQRHADLLFQLENKYSN